MSELAMPMRPSMSRGLSPASPIAPIPASKVIDRESWPSRTRACFVLWTPTMATSWNGCFATTRASAEHEVAHDPELLVVAPGDHQRRDRAVAPGLETFLDARRRTDD